MGNCYTECMEHPGREKPLVLLVDDEEMFLEIAEVQLVPRYDVFKAHGADEALAQAETLMPDLIVSDVYMPPGPNGWDLAFALRRNAKTREIPFALLTSLHDPWLELHRDRNAVTQEIGLVTILSKTDDVGYLAERVKGLL